MDRTTAERYCDDVLEGRTVACRKLVRLCEMLRPRFADGYRKWRYDRDRARRPVEFIERFCCIPSGRKFGRPMALEPYEKFVIEVAFGFVDDDGCRQFNEVFWYIAKKNGKALSLDTPIPTPDGYKTMADIHPGDYVYGVDGKPSKVLVESEIFDKPMYLVTFEDGEQVKASADHVWTVQHRCFRRNDNGKNKNLSSKTYHGHPIDQEHRTVDLTTEEIAQDVCYTSSNGYRTYNWRVPMSAPIEHEEANLPIDPYTFGVWLGDGASASNRVTCDDRDLEEMTMNVARCGHMCTVNPHKDRATTFSIDSMPRGLRTVFADKTFTGKLRKLGVLGNKHIPTQYLNASIEQRLALLQGIMDTDGFVSKKGQCEFSQKGTRMLDDMLELLSGLGMKATYRSRAIKCNGKECEAYRIQFYTDKSMPCFRLQRKYERLKDNLHPRMTYKSIRSVEPIPNEPSKCIAVDNQRHLFLCGKRYTATHNTAIASAITHYMMTSDGEGKPECYVIASAEPQAGLCYGGVDTMRRQSPSLARWERTGEVKDRKKQGILCDRTNGYVVTLSGSPKSLDGPNPHLVIADEIAAWDDRGPYDQMRLALTRSQPMMWELTTANFVRNSIGDAQYDYAKRILDGEIEDDRFLPVIYEQDEPDEWLKPETWMKSNPGLGTVKPVDKLEPLVEKAKADPAQRPAVLVKHFNIPQNQSTSWLTYAECGSDQQVDMSTIGLKYGIAGFDASDSIDLSAAQFLFMRGERYTDGTQVDDTIYERSMYWIPEDQLSPREDAGFTKERDNVPYRLWESQGLLRVVPGNHIPKSVFLEWLQELRKEKLFCFACGFDPWHMDDSTVKNLELFVGESRVRKVRQGVPTLSDPMKRLKADYARGRIVDNGHPINRWCRMNVQVKTDVNQGIQPDKRNNNPANRIDGFMAELDAYVTLLDYYDEYIQMVTSTWRG